MSRPAGTAGAPEEEELEEEPGPALDEELVEDELLEEDEEDEELGLEEDELPAGPDEDELPAGPAAAGGTGRQWSRWVGGRAGSEPGADHSSTWTHTASGVGLKTRT